MRFFRRHQPTHAPAATGPQQAPTAAERAQQRLVEERQAHAAEKAALIERLCTRYYAASALVAAGMADPSHQIGVMSGHVQALSEVTGVNEITVLFRMEHGVPPTENWLVTNDAPNDPRGDIRVLHDDIREPLTDRLDTLHRAALKATGHPMYDVLYGWAATV